MKRPDPVIPDSASTRLALLPARIAFWREEFWPSWAELKAECDKRMRGRLRVRDALRRAVA